MTDKDKKIRILWLISIIVISIGNLIYAQINEKLYGTFSPISIIIEVIIVAIFLYIYYRCAYKKPGTRLLTFSLIITPIFVIINIVMLTLGIVTFQQSGFHPLQFIATIWMYVLTWHMRSINKKLQPTSKG